VRQESHVTQLDVLVLVPLCKLVLGELVVGTGETLLHLSGERLLPVLPVDREELRDLIGTLNDSEQRIRHECLVVGGRTCHLTHDEQRCVTKLLLITSLDREFRTLLCGGLVDELLDQSSDGRAVNVEIVFPQHASVQETLKLKRLVDTCCGCARGSVRLRADTSSCCVNGCHVGILLKISMVRVGVRAHVAPLPPLVAALPRWRAAHASLSPSQGHLRENCAGNKRNGTVGALPLSYTSLATGSGTRTHVPLFSGEVSVS
jgi:hypothetical protein